MNIIDNPFYILSILPSDSKVRICQKAEERSLLFDDNSCINASAQLNHPIKRLECELSWGYCIARGDDFYKDLSHFRPVLDLIFIEKKFGQYPCQFNLSSSAVDEIIDQASLSPALTEANIIASILEHISFRDIFVEANYYRYDPKLELLLFKLINAVSFIDIDSIFNIINIFRNKSKIALVDKEEVQKALNNQISYYAKVIYLILDKIPSILIPKYLKNIFSNFETSNELIIRIFNTYKVFFSEYLSNELNNLNFCLNNWFLFAKFYRKSNAYYFDLAKNINSKIIEIGQPLIIIKNQNINDSFFNLREQLAIEWKNFYRKVIFLINPDEVKELCNYLVDFFNYKECLNYVSYFKRDVFDNCVSLHTPDRYNIENIFYLDINADEDCSSLFHLKDSSYFLNMDEYGVTLNNNFCAMVKFYYEDIQNVYFFNENNSFFLEFAINISVLAKNKINLSNFDNTLIYKFEFENSEVLLKAQQCFVKLIYKYVISNLVDICDSNLPIILAPNFSCWNQGVISEQKNIIPWSKISFIQYDCFSITLLIDDQFSITCYSENKQAFLRLLVIYHVLKLQGKNFIDSNLKAFLQSYS